DAESPQPASATPASARATHHRLSMRRPSTPPTPTSDGMRPFCHRRSGKSSAMPGAAVRYIAGMTDGVFDVVDVLIVGGGPAGLQAAVTLGRARKRVLVVDGGPRRNARAGHMNNFVSRDGIAPAEFRREARAQIAKYPNVSFRDEPVDAVTGARGDFR